MIHQLPGGGLATGIGSLTAERDEEAAVLLWDSYMDRIRARGAMRARPVLDRERAAGRGVAGQPPVPPVPPQRIRREWAQFLAWAAQNPGAALDFCAGDPQLAAFAAGKVANGG